MGYYIETPEPTDKASQIQALYGAVPSGPTLPSDPQTTLLCVVSNPLFDAVAIIYNQQELDDFNDPSDWRPRQWFTLPTAKVLEENPSAARVLDTPPSVA